MLPSLPKGAAVMNAMFLHCDIAAYRINDFAKGCENVGFLQELKACARCQYSRV